MRRNRAEFEEQPADQPWPPETDESAGRPADTPSLPAAGEVTAADAVFLRLLDVTDDPDVRSFLRRIVLVPD